MRSVSSWASRCSSASHDVLSAHCISSSTMTSGRVGGERANVFGELAEQPILAAGGRRRFLRIRRATARDAAARATLDRVRSESDASRGEGALQTPYGGGMATFGDDAIANRPPRSRTSDSSCRSSVAVPVPVSPKTDTTRGCPAHASSSQRVSDAELLNATGESIDRQRPVERFMMRQRRRERAVASLGGDSSERGRRGARRRRSNDCPCSGAAAEPIDSVSWPRPSPNAWIRIAAQIRSPDRASVVRRRARQHHDQPVADPPDVIVAAQRVPDDLGDRAKGGIRRGARLIRHFDRIDLSDQHRDRAFRGAVGHRGLGGRDELVRGPVEMGHDEGGG